MNTSSPTKDSDATTRRDSTALLSSNAVPYCTFQTNGAHEEPRQNYIPNSEDDAVGFTLPKDSTSPPHTNGAAVTFLRAEQATADLLSIAQEIQRSPAQSVWPQKPSLEARSFMASDAAIESAPHAPPSPTVEGKNWGTPPQRTLSRSDCCTAEPLISRMNGTESRGPSPKAEPAEVFDGSLNGENEAQNTPQPHCFATLPPETSQRGAPSGEPDEMLLLRLQAGEHSALEKLWVRYAPLLYSQSLKILHNPSECEDVVAEAFSEVWQRAANYHAQRAKPAAWLVTLVRRRAIDRLRERRSFEKAEERLTDEFARRTPSNSAEEHLRLADLRWLLDQALNRLTEQQRQTVSMVYFQGLTQREISERTKTPIGTIKTRLELALRKMRERIRGTRLRAMLPGRTSTSPALGAERRGRVAHIRPKEGN